jgi:hypothetical protein
MRLHFHGSMLFLVRIGARGIEAAYRKMWLIWPKSNWSPPIGEHSAALNIAAIIGRHYDPGFLGTVDESSDNGESSHLCQPDPFATGAAAVQSGASPNHNDDLPSCRKDFSLGQSFNFYPSCERSERGERQDGWVDDEAGQGCK